MAFEEWRNQVIKHDALMKWNPDLSRPGDKKAIKLVLSTVSF